MESKSFLLAGELAKRAGVSTDSLRHYERKGVLPRPRRMPNGYRSYPADALERVFLIRRAMRIGFTLDELARIFSERDGGGAPCHEVYDLATQKLAGVEEQINALKDLKKYLSALLADWNLQLTGAKNGVRAHLLENLIASDSNGQENHSSLAIQNGKKIPKSKIRKRQK